VSEANGPSGEYQISTTGPAEATYLDIVTRAVAAGVGRPVVEAMRQIRGRLRADPRGFGEPMYHLRGMRMTVRKASIRPLYIEFGVHDEQPVVIIRRVRWLDDPGTT
jgi:hypothetical protein